MQRLTLVMCVLAGAALAAAQEDATPYVQTDSTAYKYTTISDPKGTQGTQTGRINNAGEIVGRYLTASGSAGFLDKSGTFTTIIPSGATSGGALDINNSTEIVGYYAVGSGPQIAFYYSNGKYTLVKSPNSKLTSIQFDGINDSGTIVGTIFLKSATAPGYTGFIYKDGKFSSINFPSATYTKVAGISDSNEVVGGYRDSAGKIHGFEYAGGKFTAINVPGATDTFAYGISYTTGEIVGAYEETSGAVYGFLLDKEGVFTTSIAPPGSKNASVTGLNDNGDLAGFFKSEGIDKGFLAQP
jgi:hypothetical protein